MAHPRERIFRPDLLSLMAITGVIAFTIMAVVLLFVRQDFNPVKRYLSEYAVGPYGWVMQIAFCLLSLASLALALGLWSKGLNSGRSRFDIILLGIWSGGGFVAGIFPVDLQGTPLTFVGAVHLVSSSIALVSLFVAMVIFGIKFRKDPKWVGMSLPAVVLAVLAPMSFIAETVYFGPAGIPGAGHWILFSAITAWLSIVSIHLRKVSVITA